MAAIKLYAWEDPYVERITELRNAEVKQIRYGVLLFYFLVSSAIYADPPFYWTTLGCKSR